MIPPFSELAERFGPGVLFLPLVLAGLLTAPVLLIQSLAQWFDDRNP